MSGLPRGVRASERYTSHVMRRLWNLVLVAALLVAPLFSAALPATAQTDDLAEDLLAQMTVEERVGQLFLVRFQGSAIEPDSVIDQLIREHHISGVLLRAENDNFVPEPDTAMGVRELTRELQMVEFDSSANDVILDTERGEEISPTYVPLFVGISDQEGGVPLPQFVSGMSPLPTQMATGATWTPALAGEVGRTLGTELQAMGINLYLGPSLDVLEEPGQGGPGDLGSRTFGGDPFWVAEMGEQYVRGLHEGSEGQLAVIAKHFPGHGGSDRPLQEEVSTVRKSIDQLLQIELPPFFRVTQGQPGSGDDVVDGLLVTHIRYQGFQGNIRATTRPISLDPEAYGQLMALEPIAEWREQGGLTVSDSLGSRAIRRFRDPLEQRFQAQLVARDALIAGNDLLFLGNIREPDSPDELTTLEGIFGFFAQKYREDPVFSQRVDEAVLRILELKLRLYDGGFVRSRVVGGEAETRVIGTSEQVGFNVVRQGATLVSPQAGDIEARLGGAPQLSERIVFFTDVHYFRRCAECPAESLMAADALERRVNSLYGPGAAGQVGSWNLWSFSTGDLASYLGQAPSEPLPLPLRAPEEVEEPLQTADWLIFSILDVNSERFGADALQLLLNQRPDLVQGKRVVVFGFDVPYGLDATNLSRVDAYFNLYSASDPAIEVAARLLFGELSAGGAPPVSVPGIGYELIEALKPDPEQLIQLRIEAEVGEETPTPSAERGLTQGSLVSVRTSVIRDANGNPVPDDTPVEFLLTYQAENITQTLEAVTEAGIAEASFRLDRLGLLVIQARSDPALRSDVLQLDVQEGVPAFPTVIAPTPLPTDTEEPEPTPSVVPATPEEEVPEEAEPPARPRTVSGTDFLMGILGIATVAGGGYYFTARSRRWGPMRVRALLVALVGGLAVYNYVALGLPGAQAAIAALGGLVGAAAGLAGALVAFLGLLGYERWRG